MYKRKRMDWITFITVGILLAIGIYLLFLETVYYGAFSFEREILIRHCIYIVLGIIFFLVAYFMDYNIIEKKYISSYITAIILLIVTGIVGVECNGKRLWIQIGPIMAQLTIMAMLLIIVAFSGFVKKWGNSGVKGFMMLMISALVPILLAYFITGSMYCSILLVAICVGIFTTYVCSVEFLGCKKTILLKFYVMVGLLAIFIGVFNLTPVNIQRIQILMNPELDPADIGYWGSIIKSVRNHAHWIGTSNFIGEMSFMAPIGTYGLFSDYTFIFIIESLGWIVSLICLAILILFIIRCWILSVRTNDIYIKSVVVGISILFTIQISSNILMNIVGLSIDCYLPFISYSGTNIIVDLFALGVILNRSQ